MPTIRFGSAEIECREGENLRSVLMRTGEPLYHPLVRRFHCRGLGTCGTCAVRIAGKVSPPTRIEQWRLNFPPHSGDNGLRLACQCSVQGDLVIQKYAGVWGQHAGNASPDQESESS
ncbi:MAG: 2Fe-2S iron-sulfur cluster-binding protein [Planctomycetota bacterium]